MANQDSAEPRLSLGMGAITTLFSAIFAVGWAVLAIYVFHIQAVFAGYLFALYWALVDKADFKRFPRCLIGTLVGIALSWQLHYLPPHFGLPGYIVALVVVLIAVFLVIANWLPVAFNVPNLLFLTLLTAPQIVGVVNFADVAEATVLGAFYFLAIVYLAARITGTQSKAVELDLA